MNMTRSTVYPKKYAHGFVVHYGKYWLNDKHNTGSTSLTLLVLVIPITVYPKKYAHGFVVLCFVVVMQSFIMNSHAVFIHIHQGCFAGTGAIVRLPQWQWSKPDGYGKISQCITTTKHSKAKTVCICLGIYCILAPNYIYTPTHQQITCVIVLNVGISCKDHIIIEHLIIQCIQGPNCVVVYYPRPICAGWYCNALCMWIVAIFNAAIEGASTLSNMVPLSHSVGFSGTFKLNEYTLTDVWVAWCFCSCYDFDNSKTQQS